MDVIVLVFEGMTLLDAVGPYEVLSRIPGARVRFVSAHEREVRVDTGAVGIVAEAGIEEIDSADVLVVPGGEGTRALEREPGVLEWIRRIHETTTWTTSVCTGSIVLGAAGLLEGLSATTHWACYPELERYGVAVTSKRVVAQGKIVSAAGVSSGIDMGLWLAGKIAGDVVAQAIQLGIEYDPQPPYDAGHVDRAPAAVVELVRATVASS